MFTERDYKALQKIFKDAHHLFRFAYVCVMYIVISKFCHIITVTNRQQFLSKYRTVIFPVSYCITHYATAPIIMTSKYFKGCKDHYNGVTIDSNEESCSPEALAPLLAASLQQWIKEKRRTIWFRVYLPHSEWIPILVKEGFKFHHAKQEYVMLYRWLVTDEECAVPHYAHTNLGVGAFVYNEKTTELLVVKEKYVEKSAFWKLPGGYVEPGENLELAVKREVLEETGIQTTFKCLLGFRHTHNHVFGCSDIYIVAYLSPNDNKIKKCEREISKCQWMKISDYLKHSEVHENNKLVARKMLELLEHRMGIVVEYTQHPITKKPISVYTISRINRT